MSHKFKIGAKVKLIPGQSLSYQAEDWDKDYGIIDSVDDSNGNITPDREIWVHITSGEYRNDYPTRILKLVPQNLMDLL